MVQCVTSYFLKFDTIFLQDKNDISSSISLSSFSYTELGVSLLWLFDIWIYFHCKNSFFLWNAYNLQCVATTIRSQGKCECRQEHIFIDKDCYTNMNNSTFTFILRKLAGLQLTWNHTMTATSSGFKRFFPKYFENHYCSFFILSYRIGTIVDQSKGC